MDLEKKYCDVDGNPKHILEMVREEPEWTANRFQIMEKQIAEIKADPIRNYGTMLDEGIAVVLEDAQVMGKAVIAGATLIGKLTVECQHCGEYVRIAKDGREQKTIVHLDSCPATIAEKYKGE